jgi:hypothetical protein
MQRRCRLATIDEDRVSGLLAVGAHLGVAHEEEEKLPPLRLDRLKAIAQELLLVGCGRCATRTNLQRLVSYREPQSALRVSPTPWCQRLVQAYGPGGGINA